MRASVSVPEVANRFDCLPDGRHGLRQLGRRVNGRAGRFDRLDGSPRRRVGDVVGTDRGGRRRADVVTLDRARLAPDLEHVIVFRSPDIALVGQLSYQMPLWLIGSLGTPDEVARFGVGTQVFISLNFVFASTIMGAMPIIVRLNSGNDRAALRHFLQRASLISVLPIFGAVLLFAVFGGEIMAVVFGPFYRESALVGTFLSLGLLSQAALGLNPLLLTLTGSQDIVSVVQCAILLFCTMTIWLIYPVFGLYGAAIVTAALFLMQNLVLVGIVKKRFGFNAAPLWNS